MPVEFLLGSYHTLQDSLCALARIYYGLACRCTTFHHCIRHAVAVFHRQVIQALGKRLRHTFRYGKFAQTSGTVFISTFPQLVTNTSTDPTIPLIL